LIGAASCQIVRDISYIEQQHRDLTLEPPAKLSGSANRSLFIIFHIIKYYYIKHEDSEQLSVMA
jgi:hypothetical protein